MMMSDEETTGKTEDGRETRTASGGIAPDAAVSRALATHPSQVSYSIVEVRIEDIQIGERFRKDMGDITSLAVSIESTDLLQPIGITPDYRLIFGERRLRAYRDVLHKETIPTRTIHIESILLGMIAEDVMRKDHTISERFAIADALRSYKHGGDRRSEQARNCDVETLTIDEAAKLAGLGGKDGYSRAKTVLDAGVPQLVAALDSRLIALSAAAEMAKLAPDDQTAILKSHGDQSRLTAKQVRKCQKLRRIKDEQEKERLAIQQSSDARAWVVTDDQSIVPCDLLITDPPQGIMPSVDWDNPSEGIEQFTRSWSRRWQECGANYIAIFWNQRTKWEAKRWFDESLDGYDFLQECCCHRRNYKKPEGVDGHHKTFRNSWEPVFIYRRKGFERNITPSNHSLGHDLTDNDHHDASYPTTARNEDSFQQHKCQKPVSALRWLIHGLTQPGELVADPFCGSGTSGIAAMQLGRRYHGIEISDEYRRLADARISKYGVPPSTVLPGVIRTLVENDIYQGDSLDLLDGVPENTVDLALTDPPYFLHKLDNTWDRAVVDSTECQETSTVKSLPAAMRFDPEQGNDFYHFYLDVSRKLFRALKPGAFFISFGCNRLRALPHITQLVQHNE